MTMVAAMTPHRRAVLATGLGVVAIVAGVVIHWLARLPPLATPTTASVATPSVGASPVTLNEPSFSVRKRRSMVGG
ncbi:MAG TPA: hypothetical protein VGF59_00050 [Bryobacteraceae bacterium]|jgi:hypothetical protein